MRDIPRQRQKQKEWRNRRRQEWLQANGPCKRCGSWDDLEVDHIDRTTKVTHNVWNWTASRRLAELAKCQVLCKECHKIKSSAERKVPIPHGTHTGYRSHGCRCRPCIDANYARKAAWRDRRRAAGLPYT